MRRLLLVLSPLLLLIAGCAREQSTLYAGGPAAERILRVSWLMVILFLIVTLIMWVLIAWAASTRKGTLAEHAPVGIPGGQGGIVAGTLISIVILFGLFVLGLELLSSFPIHDPHQAATKPEILIIGHQWWWEVHYLSSYNRPDLQATTADEIHIPVNRPITIELESADVIHSFWVPALHGKVDLIPGHPNFIRIEASHVGAFEGECSEYCGAEHARMRLLLIAEPEREFQAWLQLQRQPGAEPTTQAAKMGEEDFLAGPCSMCHSVRGTVAGGRVAPDLTHIASRRKIAGNSYPNDKAYLEAWITHAQSLKPNAAMPNITKFDGKQMRDLVAYLQQLQ